MVRRECRGCGQPLRFDLQGFEDPESDPFQLEGQEFVALNGGPQFKFTEAVSFVVHCESQEEVDHFWSKFTAGGGQEGQCGWLKDKFGLSWQVVPSAFLRMSQDPDPAKSGRVMEAMMQMKKFDIARLEKAYRGE